METLSGVYFIPRSFHIFVPPLDKRFDLGYYTSSECNLM